MGERIRDLRKKMKTIMSVKQRLVLVIPSVQPGGMERVMSELASYFCGQVGLEVHLVLYGIKRDIFYPLPSNLIIHKPEFEFNNNRRTWNTIRTIKWLRRKLKSLRPNAVLSFGELWNNFVLFSTLGLTIPVFVSDRCQPDKSLGKLHNLLRNWLYPKAAGVICQTQKAKLIFQGMFYNQNMPVIGNPIRKIEPNAEIEKKNIILTVGRLIASKHHDELIRIFAESNLQDWKLVIVGHDALKQKNKERLQQLVEQLNIPDRVDLPGKKSNVEDYYNEAKIFAFTSSSEGFPNVIGEAMSAGLPVIAYDCVAGPADLIVDGETGFLIPLHDREMFKNRLKQLVESKELREYMGAKGISEIQQLNVEGIGNHFYEILLGEGSTN